MLFRANLPHPAFVDQAIGTHGQGYIPDMLEVLLIVQFIQIALHSSVGRAGQICTMYSRGSDRSIKGI